MPGQSATPDLVELNRDAIESLGRRDIAAAISMHRPDSVWGLSALGMVIYTAAEAIRAEFENWIGVHEEFDPR